MAKIPGDMSFPARGAALRGSFYARTNRTGQHIVAWPNKRTSTPSDTEQQNRELFRVAMLVVKNMDPLLQAFAAEVAKGVPLLPRDILMWQLYGQANYLRMPDGRKVFSVAAMQDVSGLLDAIFQLENGLLVRGSTLWQGLGVGDAGQVLTVNDDLTLHWSTPAPQLAAGWGPTLYTARAFGTVIQSHNLYLQAVAVSEDCTVDGVWVQYSVTAVQNGVAELWSVTGYPTAIVLNQLLATGSATTINATGAQGLNYKFATGAPLQTGNTYALVFYVPGASTTLTRSFYQTNPVTDTPLLPQQQLYKPGVLFVSANTTAPGQAMGAISTATWLAHSLYGH